MLGKISSLAVSCRDLNFQSGVIMHNKEGKVRLCTTRIDDWHGFCVQPGMWFGQDSYRYYVTYGDRCDDNAVLVWACNRLDPKERWQYGVTRRGFVWNFFGRLPTEQKEKAAQLRERHRQAGIVDFYHHGEIALHKARAPRQLHARLNCHNMGRAGK